MIIGANPTSSRRAAVAVAAAVALLLGAAACEPTSSQPRVCVIETSTCKKTPAKPKGGVKIECPNCDKEKK